MYFQMKLFLIGHNVATTTDLPILMDVLLNEFQKKPAVPTDLPFLGEVLLSEFQKCTYNAVQMDVLINKFQKINNEEAKKQANNTCKRNICKKQFHKQLRTEK